MDSAQLQPGSGIPLGKHIIVAARDLTIAQRAVSREIGSHRFTCATAGDEADVRLSCVRLPRSRIFGVQLGSNIVASSSPFTSLQFVVPFSGYVACLRNRHEQPVRPGAALVLRPGEPVNLLWAEHCMALVVWIDDQAIDDLMTPVFGYSRIAEMRFRPSIDLASALGRSVADALGVVMHECENPASLLNRGVTTRAVEDLLLSSLVYAAVEDAHAVGASPGALPCGAHLRRATQFISEHLQDDITVEQLAAAAGVSLRKLQYEFARQFGAGPITMIRREKLRRVRAMLISPGAQDETIGDIAATWGFFDAKYFTKMYVREFGERPSDTRRRHGN